MQERLNGIVINVIKYNDKHNIARIYTDKMGMLSFLVRQGTTHAARMRNAMFMATGAFFAAYYGLRALYDAPLGEFAWNNILWAAFMIYLLSRGIGQGLMVRKTVYGKIDN